MRTLGLLGFPLQHSFSAAYFQQKFLQEGLAGIEYINLEYSDLAEAVVELRERPNLVGFNVTIPYKTQIMPFLDRVDPNAEAIQAVNTVRVDAGKWVGYNTDVIGFETSLTRFLREYNLIPSLKALVLGTGGASKAVHFVLRKLGIPYVQVSRKAAPGVFTYGEISHDLLQSAHLIINTTPVGTFPTVAEKPELPYSSLTPKHLLFDLVYNPKCSAFLQQGVEAGCATLNGYEMLVGQAEAAWEIWGVNQ